MFGKNSIILILSINVFIIDLTLSLPIYSNCYCEKQHYTSAKIINRSILYSINNSKMEPFTSKKLNNMIEIKNEHEIENITVKGDITLVYNLFNQCHYICNMPIFYDNKFKSFILDQLDAYYKIGGYLHMMCNSTLCKIGSHQCNLVKIKDEL